jgi:S-adenosylmethionine decarboxylase proenzyme
VDTFAQHLLVELRGCNPALLDDRAALAELMRQAAAAAGARVVAEVFHPYAPHGVTGVLVIEESHFSLHTWPESAYAAVDFYTCGSCRPELAVQVLERGLRASHVEVMTVHRGRTELGPGIALHSITSAAAPEALRASEPVSAPPR